MFSASFPQHGIYSVELIGLPRARREVYHEKEVSVNSRTPLIRISWDGETSEYAENSDNRNFLCKYSPLAVRSSAVIIYNMNLLLNISTTPNLKF